LISVFDPEEKMRKKIAAGLGTVALTAGVFLASPVTAAHATTYPKTSFNVTWGNTYTKGTLTWYNRSVGLTGWDRSVSTTDCRVTRAYTYDSNWKLLGSAHSSVVCNASALFSFTVPANVVGGARHVKICLAKGSYVNVKCTSYARP
jgi:hypothetical protein